MGNGKIVKLDCYCQIHLFFKILLHYYFCFQKGDQNSATPIHLAAGAGHTGLLQFFKRASIDINIEDGEKK